MSRPEILFPLFASVETLSGVGPKTARLLEKIGVAQLRDLLLLAPERYTDRRLRESLADAEPKEVVTIAVTIGEHRPARARNRPYRVVAACPGGGLEIVHFKTNSEWMRRLYPEGAELVLSGRVELFDGRWQMPHPEHVLSPEEAAGLPPFEPVYPLTQGLTQRMVAKAVEGARAALPALPEWLDPAFLAERGWPDFAAALAGIHAPGGPRAAEAPRARLAYDELLSHQLALQLARASMRRGRGRASTGEGHLLARAAAAFGHPPTGAQARARDEILADMAAPERMLRLLQGDVGSGKTWVAAMALLRAVEAGGQGALMAPTEILARQHAHGLAPLAEAAGVHLSLMTGRDRAAERREVREAVAQGRAQIVVGTHALLQPDVAFADLRLVVIDEQHRFGVRQRMELTDKAPAGCDVLFMSATPIPRTLALAGYGDLDISLLDEKPPGRQPVETRLVSQERYGEVVARLAAALERGAQAFWVCPAVEDSDEVPLISAEARHEALARELGAERVALVHGQMAPEEKDAAMAAFQEGRARVLVATTVIEVGVDVPAASIMVVEQADQFGLAQLHQLRGRVGRGAAKSSCLLLYAPGIGETATARLQVMRETEDGFRIAEEDLRLRGAGDVLGLAQSGLPKFRVADLEADAGLMARARDEARLALHTDPELAGERGKALKILLYLMGRDQSVRLLKSG
ncbi:ATP-dependent DNA helicase RecG [Paralimibaculum aggregatum]|uniref:Probable DNA 3'-5' helicase RecG n=1 Tax=Paralimibaculum aggregatum TaxID=3036245 RepID=A0ABQ6LML4_9RHOB|nr:ATP-dependent DNA helicase RecG [Limibaculum sp. NKW23]GMG84435.1 ATP-dependent DNA helicase RecG [Limibaculum sp. NKW23]